MSTPSSYTPAGGSQPGQLEYEYYQDEHGQGLVTFAGVMPMIAGVLNTLYGIAAIDKREFFVHNARYVFGDLKSGAGLSSPSACCVLRRVRDLARRRPGPVVRRRLRERQRDPADALASRVPDPGRRSCPWTHRYLRAAGPTAAIAARPARRASAPRLCAASSRTAPSLHRPDDDDGRGVDVASMTKPSRASSVDAGGESSSVRAPHLEAEEAVDDVEHGAQQGRRSKSGGTRRSTRRARRTCNWRRTCSRARAAMSPCRNPRPPG